MDIFVKGLLALSSIVLGGLIGLLGGFVFVQVEAMWRRRRLDCVDVFVGYMLAIVGLGFGSLIGGLIGQASLVMYEFYTKQK